MKEILSQMINYYRSVDVCPKHEVSVYDHANNDLLIGFGKIIIDRKKEGRPAGLIEDIWTHENYRGQGIGKEIILTLIEQAKAHDCYKVVLICADHNIPFYEKCGFTRHQNGMRLSL